MADEFDLEAIPEEYRDQVAQLKEQAEMAAQYQGLGLDAEKLRQAAEMYQAYTDPRQSSAYREAMARQWDVLPEGMTLDELKAIAQSVSESRSEDLVENDPFGANVEEMDPYQFIEAMKKTILDEVDSRLSSRDQEQMSRAEEERAARDVEALRAQEADLYRELEKNGRNLDDDEKAFLEAAVALRLEREELTPENYNSFIRDTYNKWDSVVGNRAASLMKQQSDAPRTGGSQAEGATPGSKTVVTDFASAQKMLEEMFNQ